MPGLAILPTAQPHPFAGQNAAAFKKIFEVLGEGETMRRKKMLNTDILGILQGGGDPQKTPMENIAAAVQRHQEPTYSPEFLPSLFQKIASPFAEAPGAGITDALLKQAMPSPVETAQIKSYEALGERRRAEAEYEPNERLLRQADRYMRLADDARRQYLYEPDEAKQKTLLEKANEYREQAENLMNKIQGKVAPELMPQIQATQDALDELKPKTLTEAGVRALLEEAGGDVKKARELAKQRNLIIPK